MPCGAHRDDKSRAHAERGGGREEDSQARGVGWVVKGDADESKGEHRRDRKRCQHAKQKARRAPEHLPGLLRLEGQARDDKDDTKQNEIRDAVISDLH